MLPAPPHYSTTAGLFSPSGSPTGPLRSQAIHGPVVGSRVPAGPANFLQVQAQAAASPESSHSAPPRKPVAARASVEIGTSRRQADALRRRGLGVAYPLPRPLQAPVRSLDFYS